MNGMRFRCLIFLALAGATAPILAQVQNLVTLPTMNLNDSFYESYGVGWSVNRREPNGGFFFNNPGGAVAPAFGGFDPNAGATFGVGTNNARFNFSAAQGSNRTMISEAPMVMVPNGGGASFFSGSQRPFVTGIVPVVGAAGPTVINPLQLKLQQLKERGESLRPTPAPETTARPKSSARSRASKDDASLVIGRPATVRPAMFSNSAPSGSISDLKRQRELEIAEQREEARQKIVSARKAEAAGRYAVARSEFHLALRLVGKDDPWRPKIIECLRNLAAKTSADSSQ